ncbi:DUF362 domain-containing protein [Intestinimonas butyriciproducens]|uniref:DUF362 domain-containing protein n=1 Tax=Intestinimonas butyriciproducens TaxID=1297617 RepID=UPI001FACBB51|nr:4Fe-4S binding protein [Intestinimonas butyriciproducens]
MHPRFFHRILQLRGQTHLPGELGGGNSRPRAKGYGITPDCIGCGRCRTACPQGAIDPGTPFRIRPENCLHCGACAEACPAGAVRPRGDDCHENAF